MPQWILDRKPFVHLKPFAPWNILFEVVFKSYAKFITLRNQLYADGRSSLMVFGKGALSCLSCPLILSIEPGTFITVWNAYGRQPEEQSPWMQLHHTSGTGFENRVGLSWENGGKWLEEEEGGVVSGRSSMTKGCGRPLMNIFWRWLNLGSWDEKPGVSEDFSCPSSVNITVVG